MFQLRKKKLNEFRLHLVFEGGGYNLTSEFDLNLYEAHLGLS